MEKTTNHIIPTNSDVNITDAELVKMFKAVSYPSNIIDLTNQTITDIKMNKYLLFYSPIFAPRANLLLINELYLDNNRICCSFEKLFNIFENLTFITLLSLSNNNLGDKGAKLLSTYLHLDKYETNSVTNSTTKFRSPYNYLNYLEYLDISNNNIGVEGAKAIANSLVKHTSLIELNMSDNSICSEGANAFSKMLVSPDTTIETLYLCNNNINLSECKELAISISQIRSLLFLNISHNDCVDSDEELTDLETVLMLIFSSQSITNLYLQDTNSDDIITHYLANGLKVNNTLTHLFLSDNEISNEGVYLLFDALKNNCNTILKHLELSYNYYIDNECLGSFDELLEGNNRLQSLDMSYTDIDNQGLIELSRSKGIKNNETIIVLSFGKDDVDEDEPIENSDLTFILNRNKNLFWYPYNHEFSLFSVTMHNIIITLYLCNTYGHLTYKLPSEVLIYILTFFNRSKFINI